MPDPQFVDAQGPQFVDAAGPQFVDADGPQFVDAPGPQVAPASRWADLAQLPQGVWDTLEHAVIGTPLAGMRTSIAYGQKINKALGGGALGRVGRFAATGLAYDPAMDTQAHQEVTDLINANNAAQDERRQRMNELTGGSPESKVGAVSRFGGEVLGTIAQAGAMGPGAAAGLSAEAGINATDQALETPGVGGLAALARGAGAGAVNFALMNVPGGDKVYGSIKALVAAKVARGMALGAAVAEANRLLDKAFIDHTLPMVPGWAEIRDEGARMVGYELAGAAMGGRKLVAKKPVNGVTTVEVVKPEPAPEPEAQEPVVSAPYNPGAVRPSPNVTPARGIAGGESFNPRTGRWEVPEAPAGAFKPEGMRSMEPGESNAVQKQGPTAMGELPGGQEGVGGETSGGVQPSIEGAPHPGEGQGQAQKEVAKPTASDLPEFAQRQLDADHRAVVGRMEQSRSELADLEAQAQAMEQFAKQKAFSKTGGRGRGLERAASRLLAQSPEYADIKNKIEASRDNVSKAEDTYNASLDALAEKYGVARESIPGVDSDLPREWAGPGPAVPRVIKFKTDAGTHEVSIEHPDAQSRVETANSEHLAEIQSLREQPMTSADRAAGIKASAEELAAQKHQAVIDDAGLKSGNIPPREPVPTVGPEWDARFSPNPENSRHGDNVYRHVIELSNMPVQEISDAYDKLPGTNGGRLLSGDRIMELIPETRTNPLASHGAYTGEEFTKVFTDLLDHKLAQPHPDGEPVHIFAGAPGSGKSTFGSDHANRGLPGFSLELPSIGRSTIQRILATGRSAVVNFVVRPMSNAVASTVDRAGVERRVVTPDRIAEVWHNNVDRFRDIANHFRDNDNVHLRLIENTGNTPSEATGVEGVDAETRMRDLARNYGTIESTKDFAAKVYLGTVRQRIADGFPVDPAITERVLKHTDKTSKSYDEVLQAHQEAKENAREKATQLATRPIQPEPTGSESSGTGVVKADEGISHEGVPLVSGKAPEAVPPGDASREGSTEQKADSGVDLGSKPSDWKSGQRGAVNMGDMRDAVKDMRDKIKRWSGNHDVAEELKRAFNEAKGYQSIRQARALDLLDKKLKGFDLFPAEARKYRGARVADTPEFKDSGLAEGRPVRANINGNEYYIFADAKGKISSTIRADVVDAIDAVERGQRVNGPIGGALGEMRGVFDELHNTIKGLGAESEKLFEDYQLTGGKDIGPQEPGFIENYLGRYWKTPSEGALATGRHTLEGAKKFMLQRKIPTLREGIEMGLEPRYPDLFEAQLRKINEQLTFIAGRKIFNEAVETGAVRPVEKWVPEGFQRLDDPMFRVGGKSFMADTSTANFLNNLVSKGLMDSSNWGIRSLSRMGNAFNQLMLTGRFGVSVAHGSLTGVVAIADAINNAGLSAAEHAKIPLRLLKTPWQIGSEFERQLKLKPIEQDPFWAPYIDAYEKAGGVLGNDPVLMPHWLEKYQKAVRVGDNGRAAALAGPALLQKLSEPIMKYHVPRLKLWSFAINANRVMQNPDIAGDPVAFRKKLQEITKMNDNFYGQMRYHTLGINKMWRDAMALTIQAPGWNFGDIRGTAEAGQDVARIISGVARGNLKGVEPMRLAMAVSYAATAAALGGILQKSLTGAFPDSTDPKDWFFPKTGRKLPNGKDERVFILGYQKDFYGLADQIEKRGAVEGTAQFAKGKVSPLVSMGQEALGARRWNGERVADDPLGWLISNITPISIQQLKQQLDSGNPSPEMMAAAFAGVVRAPSHITNTRAENVLSRSLDRFHREYATHEDFKEAVEKRSAAVQLYNGNPTAMTERLKNGDASIKEFMDTMKNARTGGLDRMLKVADWNDMKDAIKVSSPEEKPKILAAMRSRVVRALDGLQNGQVAPNKVKRMVRDLNELNVSNEAISTSEKD